MKILAICQEDPEYILGGMGRHVQKLFQAMAKRGDVEIDLLVNGPDEGPKDYFGYTKHHSDKLVCWKPREPNMSSLLMSDIQSMRTVAKLLATEKRWDLVHVHEWNSIQVARLVRDALDIPMVATMHLCISKLMQGIDLPPSMRAKGVPEYSEADLYLMQQEGNLIVDSDELILCSFAYERIIREVFMTDRQINIIYNGIDSDEWKRNIKTARKVRAKFDIPNRPIALFVGRIADMKGIRPLLHAIRRWDSGYCTILVGDVNANSEEDREQWDVTHKIRDTIKKYPDRLQWINFQEDKVLKGLYSLAEIGVMPSTHEPFGIVALEFMSMGVPLVCTEVDGLREIVVDRDEKYAMIIEPNDPGQIHKAMNFLRKNEEARKELKKLGLRRVRKFNWDVPASETVNVYKKVLRRWRDDSSNRPDSGKKSFTAKSTSSSL